MTLGKANIYLQYCNNNHAAPLFLPYGKNKIIQIINSILKTISKPFNIARNRDD